MNELGWARAALVGCAAIGMVALGCSSDDSDAAMEAPSGTASSDSATASSGDESLESSTGGGDSDSGEVPEGPLWPTLDCDPLVPAVCGYPFPSNVFTRDDESTPTGRRLALTRRIMPETLEGGRAPFDVFNERDGFYTQGSIIALFPGMADTGLVGPWEYPESLGPDSTTVVLDAETGQRVAHFAELDVNGPQDEPAALLIHPAASLEYGHRYIVAIRGLVDAAGEVIEPSETFAALRDELASDEPAVEGRRRLYRDIFERLEDAGVSRDELQLAWDFTVASREDTNGRMLTMRDELLDQLPPEGPTYEILEVQEDWSESILRRIEGEVEVPLYLDDPGPGGKLVVDDAGKPVVQGTARYPFLVLVPRVAADAPVPALMLGHGMFGSLLEAEAFQDFANDQGFALVSLDWIGMSSNDRLIVAAALGNGRIDNFRTVPDRLQQSLVNFLATTRLMRTGFVQDEVARLEGEPLIDAEQTFYYGGSQGGIMGSVYMALSTDVERGVLAVPGQPYDLLLERSVNFDPFAEILTGTYATHQDVRMMIALAQLLWDRAEPAGYSVHVARDPLPGTEPHEVLMLVSIGDHQVSTLGAHMMARSIGAVNLAPTNREVWGLEVVEGMYEGSAMIEHDFGLPMEPVENRPMREGDDPHGRLGGVGPAAASAAEFLRTGRAMMMCDGRCDPD